MTTKRRYVPDPQVEQIALTEEDLRKMVRRMVREELAAIERERAPIEIRIPNWATEKGGSDEPI